MTQTSLPWANNGVGDAQTYDDDEWSDWQRKVFTTDRTKQGPIAGYLNELEVTNPSGYTLRVATGAAVVDGKIYETDANVDFTTTDNGTAIGAPGSGTNYYTVVLRKDWTAQTVRAAVLDVSTVAYPTATQTDGTTWEILLGYLSVTSGGVKTVTDARVFAQPEGCPPLVKRQGGSATDWNNSGTTNYQPGSSMMQCGAITLVDGGGTGTAQATLTYPIPFSAPPVITFVPITQGGGVAPVLSYLSSETASSCVLHFTNGGGGALPNMRSYWIAIGPR